MTDQRTVRIFISSPADVRPERLKAEQIVARLDREFAYHFHVEAVLWEREPLVATQHFQDPDNIPAPRGSDVVVVILWSRLGVMLPADKFRGAVSGRSPVTGTEWEFEDALAGAREHDGKPYLLLYRKSAPIIASLDDETALEERRSQRALVQDFMGRWFQTEDGKGYVAASHGFTTTGEFEEKLYDHLRAILSERAGATAEGVTIRWHEPPFRALLSYEYEHAPVFFGRTRARNELRELLARQIERGSAFVLVFGASGSGKSSLVKAGLLPDLALPGIVGRVGLVRRAVFRPSDTVGDPIAALAAAILSATALPELAGLRYTPERLSALLSKLSDEARLPIEQGLAEAGKAAGLTEIAEARLVVVVDQLEEIFTIDRLDQSARDTFVAVLDRLAKSGLVWVIATMRSDFFDRLETSAGLALARLAGNEAIYRVLPPDETEIGQIIRQPALEAGLRFEHDAGTDMSLDETIRQASAHDHGALPLLSFLLDQLWQRRSETGVLTFAAYRDLGGLEGAIGRRAEEVFQAQPVSVQRELVSLLRELVTIEGGKPMSRAAPLSRFPAGTPRQALVEAFLDPEARLLVGSSDQGEAQLRLAHEALLSHWKRAGDQIATDARDLELRGRLEAETEAWQAAVSRREKKGRLIAGLALSEARALLARWGRALPEEISNFIGASRRAATGRRVRLWGMIAGAPLAMALLSIVVWTGLVWRGVRNVEAEWAAEQAFIHIPAGCFEMGNALFPSESPVHQVCVKDFDLDKFDVTQWEWRQVMISIPGFDFPMDASPSDRHFKGDRQPIEQVSWNDAQVFIRLMSFFGRYHYRLPSESEWEYAARGGTTTAFFWGERGDEGCAYAKMPDIGDQTSTATQPAVNCHRDYGPEPVGSFMPNPWGLYDMAGNVAQWVEDCFVSNYREAPSDGSAIITRDCNRVGRGGSWKSLSVSNLRTTFRNPFPPNSGANFIGFRLARTIAP